MMTATNRTPCRWCSILLALLVFVLAAPGCEAIAEFGESEPVSGPINRTAKRPNTECYDSFEKFKRVKKAAGDDMDWHHIVGKHSANQAKFGRHDLNCTDNLIRLPRTLHREISGHYSRKPEWAQGKTIRAWLAEKGFDEQYEYGIKLLKRHGINW